MAKADSITPAVLRCTRCNLEKPIDSFRRRSGRRDTGKRRGRWSHCIECEKEQAKLPHRRKLANKAMTDFRARLRATDYKEFRRRERDNNLKRKYGIGEAGYQKMLAAQNGKCAICGGPPIGGRWAKSADGKQREQRFHVDHDHKTGAVRALLCSRCNRGIGSFVENSAIMRKAATYIESFTVTVPV